jgi:hypothetical protein
MTLGELIEALKQEDPARVIKLGFNEPHSYRGYYERLAFEPRENVSVGSMLEAARAALGSTYEGYKGGDYTMDEYTDCYLAHYGSCGDEISGLLLRYMLADVATEASR